MIPDADFIHVGRHLMMHAGAPTFEWCVKFAMPRRDRAYRVLRHRGAETVVSHGATLEEAKANAVRDARYQRTGAFEERK